MENGSINLNINQQEIVINTNLLFVLKNLRKFVSFVLLTPGDLMMYIEEISIVNFKNLKDVQVEFSPRLNCLIGNNGAGKTNLMDAVYYLSFCKSFFTAVDQFNINHDEQFFMLNGNYKRLSSN